MKFFRNARSCLASARAASAPKPLEALVTAISFFSFRVMVCFFKKDLQQNDPALDHSPVCAKHLAVDPTPVRTSQE
jgi:hypothetical protein